MISSRAIRRLRVGAVLVALLGVCSCARSKSTRTNEGLPPVTSALAKPSARTTDATNTEGFVKTFSVASVVRDTLDECIDFTIRVDPTWSKDSQWRREREVEVRARLDKLGTPLGSRCTDQFADQLVLATCYAVTKRDGQELELVQRYYNPTTAGLEDLYMQECLRLGGTWEALAVDSPAFKKARARAKLRELAALATGSG